MTITDEQLAEWKRLAEEWRTHGVQRPGEHVIRCQRRIDADRRRISKAMGEAFPILVAEIERLTKERERERDEWKAKVDRASRCRPGCASEYDAAVADNERLRRGLGVVKRWNDDDRPMTALSHILDNLLAGREWDTGEVKL